MAQPITTILDVKIPLVMLIMGLLMLSPEHLSQKKKAVIGGLIGLVILTGLSGAHGGSLGQAIIRVAHGAFGPIGAFAVLITLLVMDIAIVLGTTMGTLFDRLNFFNRGDRLPGNVKVIEPGTERVSVFTTVRRKIGWGFRFICRSDVSVNKGSSLRTIGYTSSFWKH